MLDYAIENFFLRCGILNDLVDGVFWNTTNDAVGLSAGIKCALLTGKYTDFAKKATFARCAHRMIRAVRPNFGECDEAF